MEYFPLSEEEPHEHVCGPLLIYLVDSSQYRHDNILAPAANALSKMLTTGLSEHLATGHTRRGPFYSLQQSAVQTHHASLGCGSRLVVLPSRAPAREVSYSWSPGFYCAARPASSNARGEPQTPTGVRHSARNRTPPSRDHREACGGPAFYRQRKKEQSIDQMYLRTYVPVPRHPMLPSQVPVCAVCNLGLFIPKNCTRKEDR